MSVWFSTDVAVCVSVTPLKTGAKHRRSRRPCWRAVPTTTWLTLTITWMIWGTTGPTLWSTSPSWICANSGKHIVAAHTDTRCSMLLAVQHRSVPQAAHVPSRVPTGSSVALTNCITESRATAANALLACSHFKKGKTRWGSNVWWMQDLTWHFLNYDCFLRFVG